MFENRYEKRKREIITRINVDDYIRQYTWVLFQYRQKPVIKQQSGADYYQRLFNDPMKSPLRSMLGIPSGELYKYTQGVEYVPSNLGKGYIWYFICNWCGRRAKYLYVDQNLEALLCRKCIKFPYRQPTRRERFASRYIRRHPDLVRDLIDTGKIPAY